MCARASDVRGRVCCLSPALLHPLAHCAATFVFANSVQVCASARDRVQLERLPRDAHELVRAARVPRHHASRVVAGPQPPAKEQGRVDVPAPELKAIVAPLWVHQGCRINSHDTQQLSSKNARPIAHTRETREKALARKKKESQRLESVGGVPGAASPENSVSGGAVCVIRRVTSMQMFRC